MPNPNADQYKGAHMTLQEMKQANEQQLRAFESWLRDLQDLSALPRLRAVVPAEQVEASGHGGEDEL
jgi:hypothetical protein